MERRLDRLSRAFGASESCGPIVLVAPNSWTDADRDAWERAQILHDEDAEGALIERYAGHPVRPCRCPRRHFNVIVVPAPASVEESSEDERAAWRQGVR
jgi:hypothetical protein